MDSRLLICREIPEKFENLQTHLLIFESFEADLQKSFVHREEPVVHSLELVDCYCTFKDASQHIDYSNSLVLHSFFFLKEAEVLELLKV